MTVTTYPDEHDEETPLLPKCTPSKTPLRWSQIGIIMFIQLCEPLTSQSIYPYINQLISELNITGGDEKKVGYYAGLIESLFFVTEACTVLQWSRASDRLGRKPVLLVGLFGLCISMLCFGLSRTFLLLVVSRCICGMLNGNIGVMKSVMGELTDSSNRAEGFSLMPVVWSAGATLGPLVGGGLSKPYDRFPTLFTTQFWKEYPYFLPCAVVSAFVGSAFLITLFFFHETLGHQTHSRRSTSVSSSSSITNEGEVSEGPVPLKTLLKPSVMIPISNYVFLAFLNIGLNALQPLFFAMPLEIGGLGMDPPAIGYILGSFGALNGLFQALFFAKIIHRFNPKRVFITGITSFIPIFCLFPFINAIARTGAQTFVWSAVAVQLLFCVLMDMAYGCIFMFVTAAAPNKRSLGATNGLAQTTVSIARAIGPALTTSLFSFSVEYNLLGGKLVYAILVLLAICALGLAEKLPDNGWIDKCEN